MCHQRFCQARKARFALYGNPDQTATAAVERMPAQLGAAVKARVNAIARAAKSAGMADSLPLLEAKVATGLLLGNLPDIPPPSDEGPADPWDDGWPADWLISPGAPGRQDGRGQQDPASALDAEPDDDSEGGRSGTGSTGGTDSAMMWPRVPAQAGRDAPGCQGLPAWLRPKVPGRIRLTVRS